MRSAPLVVALTLLLVVPAPPLAAQAAGTGERWRALGLDSRSGQWAFDVQTLRRSGSVVTGWVRILLADALVDTTRSVTRSYTEVLENFRIDCDALTIQTLYMSRSDSTKRVVWQTSEALPPSGVRPESMNESPQREACRLTLRR